MISAVCRRAFGEATTIAPSTAGPSVSGSRDRDVALPACPGGLKSNTIVLPAATDPYGIALRGRRLNGGGCFRNGVKPRARGT